MRMNVVRVAEARAYMTRAREALAEIDSRDVKHLSRAEQREFRIDLAHIKDCLDAGIDSAEAIRRAWHTRAEANLAAAGLPSLKEQLEQQLEQRAEKLAKK
jgi:hypothetical protein